MSTFAGSKRTNVLHMYVGTWNKVPRPGPGMALFPSILALKFNWTWIWIFGSFGAVSSFLWLDVSDIQSRPGWRDRRLKMQWIFSKTFQSSSLSGSKQCYGQVWPLWRWTNLVLYPPIFLESSPAQNLRRTFGNKIRTYFFMQKNKSRANFCSTYLKFNCKLKITYVCLCNCK